MLIFINCVTSHNLTYLGIKKTEYYGVQDRELISVKKQEIEFGDIRYIIKE